MTPVWQKSASFNHKTHRALAWPSATPEPARRRRMAISPCCLESIRVWRAMLRQRAGRQASLEEPGRRAPSVIATTTVITRSKGPRAGARGAVEQSLDSFLRGAQDSR